jgi:hypothetical protein
MLGPTPVTKSTPPLIVLSMTANNLNRRTFCKDAVTSNKYFDISCFTFIVF